MVRLKKIACISNSDKILENVCSTIRSCASTENLCNVITYAMLLFSNLDSLQQIRTELNVCNSFSEDTAFVNLHQMVNDLNTEFPSWGITFKKVTNEEDCPTKQNGRKVRTEFLIPLISENDTQVTEVCTFFEWS